MKLKDILFSFNGRIPRLTFILYGLGVVIAFFVLYIFAPALILARMKPETVNPFRIFIFPIMLAQLSFWVWIHLALCFKRFHDCGKPGWLGIFHTFVGILPIILMWIVSRTDINDSQNPFLMAVAVSLLAASAVFPLASLFLAVSKGTDGPNPYGPPPE